jgi:dTDP-4-amino-4,6-dideoxygalactose transaminase
MQKIPFNKPFIAGKELYYIAQAVTFGNLGDDGYFTRRCAQWLEEKFSIPKVLLTPSCTAALEMAAMLLGIDEGDEVILPSFTFVSTASAFVRLGARPVFVDIRPDTLNLDEQLVAAAITPRTKAIVPVHYAGIGCALDRLQELARAHGLALVEDAAQGVNSFYRDRALGSWGTLGCYSFHETKNYICGEGGALCLNDPAYVERAEIIRDKGTNRKQFLRGQVDKYTWVDVGSSYVPSELCSAFLFAQLEMLQPIADRRRQIYEAYHRALAPLAAEGLLRLPVIPPECTSNSHMFYILVRDRPTRDALLAELRGHGIHAVFHYIPLHSSPMGVKLGGAEKNLPVTDDASGRLLRLPLFHEITQEEQSRVVETISRFLRANPSAARATAAAGLSGQSAPRSERHITRAPSL